MRLRDILNEANDRELKLAFLWEDDWEEYSPNGKRAWSNIPCYVLKESDLRAWVENNNDPSFKDFDLDMFLDGYPDDDPHFVEDIIEALENQEIPNKEIMVKIWTRNVNLGGDGIETDEGVTLLQAY